MILCSLHLPVSDFVFAHAYVAKITGSDPNYILHRQFLEPDEVDGFYEEMWNYELEDGIYEICETIYDNATGDRVHRGRKWLVVLDDWEYEYAYDDMNAQYVLYTVWCLNLQKGGEAGD